MAFDEEHRRHPESSASSHYIVASRTANLNATAGSTPISTTPADGFTPVLRQAFPAQSRQRRRRTSIEVKDLCTGDDDEQTYVLCRSEQRIAKEIVLSA